MIVARELVQTLAADPAFRSEVAEEEIERRIQAGLLIPAERLQVAPGLTLVPVGRVESLEALLAEILAVDGAVPPELAGAASRLLEPAPPPEEPEAAPERAEPDQAEPAAEGVGAAGESEPDPAEETAPPAKGARRELPTEPLPCEECGTTALTEDNTPEANLEQTKFAVVRFRRPLCRPCMASQ